MEKGIEKAIEQMGQKDEAGLNYIYSKTYNFVYLRAKSILKNEEDIKLLMKKVYLQAYESVDGLRKENLYEWLGKRTYLLGCQYYKKRKEREISYIEIEKNELHPRKVENSDVGMEIINGILEELPDMYQATLFAFYYDYLKVDEIAGLMDCSSGVIKNRLNYIRKYIKKAIENYTEEHGGEEKMKITFSVEILCNALREWSVEHCLGITTAQRVYTEICKEAGLKAGFVYVEGKEFAGVNNTVVYHKQDDFHALEEEILHYEKKRGVDKKNIPYMIGIGVLILFVIVTAAIAFHKPKKEKPAEKKPPVTADIPQDEKMDEPAEAEEQDESTALDEPDVQEEANEPEEDVPAEDTEMQAVESEYIFEKSNTEALTREEVQTHTKEELRFARNEIYARHGVIFGVEDLDTYFRSKSWYKPKMSLSEFFDTVEMSMVEEENINLISEVESSM